MQPAAPCARFAKRTERLGLVMMQSTQAAASLPRLKGRAEVFAAIAAGLLGLFLIWGVGFANPAEIHNAAHDSRHSMVFPCH